MQTKAGEILCVDVPFRHCIARVCAVNTQDTL